MKDTSEDEQADGYVAPSSVYPKTLKTQSERAEQLRKMMEDEGSKINTSRGVEPCN